MENLTKQIDAVDYLYSDKIKNQMKQSEIEYATKQIEDNNKVIKEMNKYVSKLERGYLKEKERTADLEYILGQLKSQLLDTNNKDSFLIKIINNALKNKL